MISLNVLLSILGTALTLIAMICGGLAVYVRMAIQTELALFLVQLNGTYLRTAVYVPQAADTEARLARLERTVDAA